MNAKQKNFELAGMFDRIADALEYKGELAFRIIAYRKAARALEELTDDIEVLAKAGKLRTIPGVGEGIAKKIEEYLTTGKMKKFEETMAEIPTGLLELLNVQNLGPKTLALAHKELAVNNRDDLKRVIDDGSLAKLFRMGEKKVENIKKGLEIFGKAQERISIDEALSVADEMVAYLRKIPGVKQVEPAGSLRRMKETIGDIDILVSGKNGAEISEHFTRYPGTSRVLASGETKSSIVVGQGKNGRQVDIRIVPESSFGAALQYFTGSKDHNVKIRSLARDRGLKVSEYGVFRGERKIAGKTEEEVYKTLGLPYIPPELREDRGEVEAARAGKLPVLVELKDIKGDLHVHSDYSDGVSTIEEIANGAQTLGYDYVAICDHSQSVYYAHGLAPDRLKRQSDEIDRLNEKLKGIKILKGTEVDILKSGRLDFPDTVLEKLDVVVAAIHQSFKERVTERISDALTNPNVDIIAHPTGRVISRREGYIVDIERVLEKARTFGKAMELNAYFDRLDLNELYLRKAKELGVAIAISTDSHAAPDLRWMRFGIGIARRGWLEKKDVLNTLTVRQLKKVLGQGNAKIKMQSAR